MPPSPQVLIVDDERDLVRLLEFNLQQAGFETAAAYAGVEALEKVRQRVPDLVVLDLMLPDIPGNEVCRQLKASPRTRHVPVLMLTARTDEVDRVVGFEVGADDFVTKPFSVRELVLRIRAILRRGGGAEAEIALTALEFKLLTTFMSRLGRVQTREALLQDVWGVSSDLQTRTVDTHVKRLREKLGAGRDLIETVRGIGYRMVEPER